MSSRRHLKSAGSLPGIVWQDTFLRDGTLNLSYPDIGAGQWTYTDSNIGVTAPQAVEGVVRNMEGDVIMLNDGILQLDRVYSEPGTHQAGYHIRPGVDFSKLWELEFDSLGLVSSVNPLYGTFAACWLCYLNNDNHIRVQNHPATLGAGYRRVIIVARNAAVEERFEYEFAVPDFPDESIFTPLRAVYNGSTVAIYVDGVLAATIVNPFVIGPDILLTFGAIMLAGDSYYPMNISRVAVRQ